MPTVRGVLRDHAHEVAKVGADATVLDAVRVMTALHVGAVVVTRGEKVVGIFTERDLLTRVVSRQIDPAGARVADVMTSPVACCTPETTRAECRALMKARHIRHLPVVEQDRLIGLVSIRDILEDEHAEQEETIRYLYEYMYGEWSTPLAGARP